MISHTIAIVSFPFVSVECSLQLVQYFGHVDHANYELTYTSKILLTSCLGLSVPQLRASAF
jgi:hypothetical protein